MRDPTGKIVAELQLIPVADRPNPATAPLVEIAATDAREHGETTLQLREGERYEYEVIAANGADLRLRCSLATRRKSLGTAGTPDAGLIETRSFCGTLLLELVQGNVDHSKSVVGSALIDVRSSKVDYRTDYRGMLRRLADELSGLVADSRSSAKTRFRSLLEGRRDVGSLQIQLEMLRETLDSTEFSAALRRILRFPHERLLATSELVAVERPVRLSAAAIRQLMVRQPRRAVPAAHPLRSSGFDTISKDVEIQQRTTHRDTPENRFVKFALQEFRAFLSHSVRVYEDSAGWAAPAALARRLEMAVAEWLNHDLFHEVGEIHFAPLGSPVLQRKAGYRELLRWWLRFHTSAQLSWDGGKDVFHAGQRDVATLYEYWLFFELLGWFCRTCRDGNRPAVEELVEGLDGNSPNLRLRKRFELGPFVGRFDGQGRSLSARFTYNRRFDVSDDRFESGSWTRRLHPDYTLTFWPSELAEDEAERKELLVHIHLDAKYRVEDVVQIFGTVADDGDDEAGEGTYKRQDLLKMHAYRDAIKRSQGAYILYPGRNTEQFRGFHEVIPGLGAFGISPNEEGAAEGFDELQGFLFEVLSHLCNRTTAQERLSFHTAETYTGQPEAVSHTGLRFSETDVYGPAYRALPPAEHMVLVAWYRNETQLRLAQSANGIVFIRLGRRPGAFHVHANLARVRHLVLRSESGIVAPGMLVLREPGFRVYGRSELRGVLRRLVGARGVTAWDATAADDDENFIYAVFKTSPDSRFSGQRWDGQLLMSVIESFESDVRNKPISNLGRTSPNPRIISLQRLLATRLI